MAQPVRETWQAGFIRQVKLSTANVLHMLMDHAGKSGKPAAVTGAINGEIANVAEALEKVGTARKMRPEVVAKWAEFVRAWKTGNGSWTDCKRIVGELNHILQNTD